MDDNDEMDNFFGNENFDDEPTIEEEDGVPSDAQVLNKLFADKETVPVPKRRVLKPQPKLNEATLIGPKGIASLRDSFKDYKPNAQDPDPYASLSGILKKYEHWAHVMFPKMKFDDVISRCETLGDKRAVKVYMMKSRLDMPLTDFEYDALTSTKKTGDVIIETESNEDGVITTRDDGDDDDENYYDPFEDQQSTSSKTASSKPSTSTSTAEKFKSSTDTTTNVSQTTPVQAHESEMNDLDLMREAEEAERLRMEAEADEMMRDMDDWM